MFSKKGGVVVYVSIIISATIITIGTGTKFLIVENKLNRIKQKIDSLHVQVNKTKQIIEAKSSRNTIDTTASVIEDDSLKIISSTMHIRFYDCSRDNYMGAVADSILRFRSLIIGVGIRDSANNSVSEVDYIWGAYREQRLSSLPLESRDTSKQAGFSNQVNVLPPSRRNNSRKPMSIHRIAHLPQGLPAFDTTLADFVYPTASLKDFLKSDLILFERYFFKRGCYLDLEVNIRFQDNWRVHAKFNRVSFDYDNLKPFYVFKLPRPSKN